MTFKPYPVLTAFTAVSLLILLLLGNWQYGKFSSKMAAKDQVGPAPGIELVTTEITVDASKGGNAQLAYGIVDGEVLWRRYVPARIKGRDGVYLALWDMVGGVTPVPLALEGLGTDNRALAVFEKPDIDKRFASKDKPEDDVWYTYDAAAMLANMGWETPAPLTAEPLRVTVQRPEIGRSRTTDNPYAALRVKDPLPPQRHFGYAITWWGLGIALFAIYLVFHHVNGRLRFRAPARGETS